MGRTGAICYAAPILILSACSDSKADDIQVNRDTRTELRLLELETKVTRLERYQRETADQMKSLTEGAIATAETVARNAKIANDNWVKEMTAEGACGQEYIRLENGAYRQRNKECTPDDLKPLKK